MPDESIFNDPPLRAEPLDLPPAAPFADDGEIPPEPSVPTGELPGEVLAVWGVSEESLEIAKTLIAAWGIDRFLGSELHTQAKKEQVSDTRMAPIREAFAKSLAEKESKKKR